MAGFIQDLRLGFRSLLKNPGYAAMAILTLALGIGANTAIFSVIHSVIIQPLPFPEPERLVRIWETKLDRGWDTISLSEPNFWDLRDMNSTFEEMAVLGGRSVNLTGDDYPQRLNAGFVTAGFFRVLGVDPLAGRMFLQGEDDPASENRLVLLSHDFWRTRLGSDPGAVGSELTINGEPHEVVGIVPDGEPFLSSRDIFILLVRDPEANRGNHILVMIGRLEAGVTTAAALADLEIVSAQLAEQYPDVNGGMGVRFGPSEEWRAGESLRRQLWILMGSVGFLLLIACVNLANLLLAKATGRRREIAVNAALGASRGRIVRRALTESALLGLLGAAAGLILAFWGIAALKAFEPGNLPRIEQVGINGWILGFTLIISVLTGLAAGLLPALQTSYTALTSALSEGERGGTGGRGQRRLRGFLVTAEVALSLVLLIGAGLLVRSFTELQQVDRGFQEENRLTYEINLPPSYDEDNGVWQFLQEYLTSVEALPQVASASAVSMRPIRGGTTNMGMVTEEQFGDEEAILLADWREITPGYFETMGIPLLRGRIFTDQDELMPGTGVIVSQALAERLWPGEDPLGRRAILWSDPDLVGEIIGVVGNMRERGLENDPTLAVYLPYNLSTWTPVHIVVHTLTEPHSLVPELRAILAQVDRNLPLSRIQTLEELITDRVSARRFNTLLMSVFAGVALLLALAGIYGVLAYAVSRRTSEIGIRVALGASPHRVLRMVIAQGMRPALVGIVLGLLGAFWLARFMESLLYGVETSDPITYLAVSLLFVAATAASCYLPARRALRVDPVTALRRE